MPVFIDRDTLREQLGRVQLIEVLEPESYRELHLPGAHNIPLRDLDRRGSQELRRDVAVVAYCHDYA